MTLGGTKQVDVKEQLSLIYGDNVISLFNRLAFVWEEDQKVDGLKTIKIKGKILFSTGEYFIRDSVEDVIELKSRGSGIIGYSIFLNGDIQKIFSVKKEEIFTLPIMVISKDLKIEVGKIKSRHYTLKRPEVVLEYNFKVYSGQFDLNGDLISFVSM